MLDAISVERHGFDTVRATFRVLDVLPVHDNGYREALLDAGFRRQSQDWVEDGELVSSEKFLYRDPSNSTLSFELRGMGEWVATEFSAPRLLEDSPVNLALASSSEVEELLGFAAAKGTELIPEAPGLELHKLNRLDYAVDVAAGDMLPAVISAASQFRFPRARKASTHVYPGETATIRASDRTFRCYGKGGELRSKLRPAERVKFAPVIENAKAKGLTRMELMNRKKGGLAKDCLPRGAFDFAEALETGLAGGVVVVGGLAALEAQIAALEVSPQRKATLLQFATRYAVLGVDAMQERYSRRTFFRHRKMFRSHGLRLDELCTYQGEVDFRPAIEHMRLAA